MTKNFQAQRRPLWSAIPAMLIALSSNAYAAPLAKGDVSRPECIDAMKLANAMYASAAPRLFAPLEIPKEMQSRLILGASERDISGGDVLENGPEFEKLPRETGAIYWATKADGSRRIVLENQRMGWRGDVYDLYLLEPSVRKTDFLGNIHKESGDKPYQPVIAMAWRPPLVFQDNQQGTKWVIDVGHPAEVLGGWKVYAAQSLRPVCSIAFHAEGATSSELLPQPVNNLARKLDEALGPGNDEGTLQPTAWIRLGAQHLMANAALRPWALSEADAYNTRQEVDSGLVGWAKGNHARSRLYEEIRKAYPAAEKSLAAYYAIAYGLQGRKSEEVAKWALDLMFRSYFVFPRQEDRLQDRSAQTNPWPRAN
jgi:hypothetical protein